LKARRPSRFLVWNFSANLSKYGGRWIKVSECNYDILEKSYHFDPGQKTIGKFSDPFLEVVREKFGPFLRPDRPASTGRNINGD